MDQTLSCGLLSTEQVHGSSHYLQDREFKGNMNRMTQRKLGLLLAGVAMSGGCSFTGESDPRQADLYRELLETLGSGGETALYAAAAVHTPRGLWNVYVMSAPPDRLIFRQSRQDGEVEFGLTGNIIWREDMLTGQSRALDAEWQYFVRSYEIFRLGSRLAEWQIHESRSGCREIFPAHEAAIDLCLLDDFGQRVSVRVGADNLPVRIVRELPAEFGGGVSRIVPSAWTPQNGELLMTGFEQSHGTAQFAWDIQSVRQVPEQEISINPPATLLK